ncbi:MAG TPA: Holliday junction branch migration protein RuvA, partial [Deltaproteobacteria bacterium]|nr:Holliday junction branch migration protein RuvA [Deltaproteobacteria bacterium]
MIARLTGTIVEVRADDLVIDVNGVGYLVAAPATLVMSATVGSDIMLSISTVVREDAFLL